MQNVVLVSVMNGARHLDNEFHRLTDRHWRAPYHFVELAAFDEFHTEIVRAIALTDFMDWHDTGMLQASCRFRFEAKALQVGFARPLTKANDFYSDCAIETLLPRTEHHALTAASDFFQQFVIAKVRQPLRRMWTLSRLGRSIGVTPFNIFNGAAALASGYRRAREQTKAGLEETARAASLRSVRWDLGSALWANSEYASHCQGATGALPYTA